MKTISHMRALGLAALASLILMSATASLSPAMAAPASTSVNLTGEAERRQLAGRVLQAQQDLLRRLREPSVSPAAFREQLRAQQASTSALLRQSEALRLALFTHPPVSQDAQDLYLNNYKQPQPLDPEERRAAYWLELFDYLRQPHTGSRALGPELLSAPDAAYRVTGYDFVILADDRVRLASVDLVDDPLSAGPGPNHTILASGGPVKSAGQFFVHQQDGKRLIFVANKSGHYLPDYGSLELLRPHLIAAGAAPEEILLLAMGGHYANVVYKYFYPGQVKLAALTPASLQARYAEAWLASFAKLDLKAALEAETRRNELTRQPPGPLFTSLKAQRKQALYLGSVYFLMDKRHRPPAIFERYIDRFGIAMDAAASGKTKLTQERLGELAELAADPALKGIGKDFQPETRAGFQAELGRMEARMRERLEAAELSVDDMHQLRIDFKHLLFLYMAQTELDPGQILPELLRTHLQRITDRLGELHDHFVAEDLAGRQAYTSARVTLEPELRKYMRDTLEHAIEPLKRLVF